MPAMVDGTCMPTAGRSFSPTGFLTEVPGTYMVQELCSYDLSQRRFLPLLVTAFVFE